MVAQILEAPRVLMPEHTRPTPFAEFLAAEIQSRGISPRQVAIYAGVSPNTVSNWLRGISVPKHETLLKLSAALGIPYEKLRTLAYPANDAETSDLDSFIDEAEARLQRWFSEGQDILKSLRRRGRPT